MTRLSFLALGEDGIEGSSGAGHKVLQASLRPPTSGHGGTIFLPERWPGPRYEFSLEFNAPLEFVYRWCTDYAPEDGRLEGEEYQRRVVRCSRREVVYEDLSETKAGWRWARHVVRLSPPDRWHSDSVGSHRAVSLDYELSSLSGNRTRIDDEGPPPAIRHRREEPIEGSVGTRS